MANKDIYNPALMTASGSGGSAISSNPVNVANDLIKSFFGANTSRADASALNKTIKQNISNTTQNTQQSQQQNQQQTTTTNQLSDEDLLNLRNVLARLSGQYAGTVPTNTDFQAMADNVAKGVLQAGMGDIIAQGTNVGAFGGSPQATAANRLSAQATVQGAQAATQAQLQQDSQLQQAIANLTNILKGSSSTAQTDLLGTLTQQGTSSTDQQSREDTISNTQTSQTGQTTDVGNSMFGKTLGQAASLLSGGAIKF